MAFLYPNMLYGLFALAIPLIVHLFNFRRHKLVYFSNTALLHDLQQQQSNTNRIKHLLVLLMRLLFVAAVVLAFAQPYRAQQQLAPAESRLVVLYLDNSVSMQMPAEKGALIDESRREAMRLVRDLPYSASFVLLTNQFEVRNERPMNRDEMMQQLELVSANGPSVQLSEVLTRAQSLRGLQQFSQRDLLLMSDFQATGVHTDEIKSDSLFNVYLIPFKATLNTNVYIDSCWLASPVVQVGIPALMQCRLRNESEQEVKGVAINMTLNGRPETVANTDIPANGFADVELQFVLNASANYQGVLSLTDFPIVFDDEYFFSIDVRDQINILEVYGEQPLADLSLLYGTDEVFNFRSQQQLRLDLQSLPNYQQVIFHSNIPMAEGLQDALAAYVKNGGSLLLLPAESFSPPSTLLTTMSLAIDLPADTAQTVVQTLASQHEIFKDVFVRIPEPADLPRVKQHYRIQRLGSLPGTELIGLRNGDPFLVETNYGKGHFYLMATPLDASWTTLTSDPLFVPLMYRMAFIANSLGPLSYTIGKDRQLSWKGLPDVDEKPLRIVSADGQYEQLPLSQRNDQQTILTLYNQLPNAGFYEIYQSDSLLQPMAWNESRDESVLRFVDAQELKTRLEGRGIRVAAVSVPGKSGIEKDWLENGGTTTYWKIFAIIALLALLAETLLLRFWREPVSTSKKH